MFICVEKYRVFTSERGYSTISHLQSTNMSSCKRVPCIVPKVVLSWQSMEYRLIVSIATLLLYFAFQLEDYNGGKRNLLALSQYVFTRFIEKQAYLSHIQESKT